jgi:hypothetical protein
LTNLARQCGKCGKCGRELPGLAWVGEAKVVVDADAEDTKATPGTEAILKLCTSKDPACRNVHLFENAVGWLLSFGVEHPERTIAHPSVHTFASKYVQKFACDVCTPREFAVVHRTIAEASAGIARRL